MVNVSSMAMKDLKLGNWSIAVNTSDPEHHEKIIEKIANQHHCKNISAVAYHRAGICLTSFIISFFKIKDKEEFITEIKQKL